MAFRLTVALVAVSLLSVSAAASERSAHPEITLDYSPYFDGICAEITKQPVEAAATKELSDRLDSFREHWRDDAPKLLGAAVDVTGVDFQFQEARAALYLCPGFGYSLSLPLLINMRHFIVALQGERVRPMSQFSYSLFHEILHRYVTDRINSLPDRTTPLLAKYGGEALPVRNHLHLFAILNEVYRELDRQEELGAVIAFERTSKVAPILDRAREIVDREGAEAFLAEFRGSR